jgi:hypothetical protein
MTSAKRRINSTGRKRIPREKIDIRLHPIRPGEPLSVSASTALSDQGFPSDALVLLEAYQRSSGMRFECGTVGHLAIPPVLQLNEIDPSGTVLFRVEVVEVTEGTGRILGSADRLRPRDGDSGEGRRSIFPIREQALGDEVWRVVFDEAGPVLVLNSRITGFKHRILENPFVQGIILPTAFRAVLDRLAADATPHDEDDEDWRELWLRYLKEQFAIDDDLSELTSDERSEWVDATVARFCQAHSFVDRIRTADETVG